METAEGFNAEMLSLGFSNFSLTAGKLLRNGLAGRFSAVARSLELQYERSGPQAPDGESATLDAVESHIRECVDRSYPAVKGAAGANRGALRAFTWGSKVAAIVKSMVGRVRSKGDELVGKGQSFFVCEGCGFIYLGESAPDICPVCKAPSTRFARF
ncbi:rubredoxin-like domain-containing protein [Salinispira pacifica]